jgi:ankyrin repeat protein
MDRVEPRRPALEKYIFKCNIPVSNTLKKLVFKTPVYGFFTPVQLTNFFPNVDIDVLYEQKKEDNTKGAIQKTLNDAYKLRANYKFGFNCLMSATLFKDLPEVLALLILSYDADCYYNRIPDLHEAVRRECLVTAKLLLNSGEEIDLPDQKGITPLEIAVQCYIDKGQEAKPMLYLLLQYSKDELFLSFKKHYNEKPSWNFFSNTMRDLLKDHEINSMKEVILYLIKKEQKGKHSTQSHLALEGLIKELAEHYRNTENPPLNFKISK